MVEKLTVIRMGFTQTMVGLVMAVPTSLVQTMALLHCVGCVSKHDST